MTIDIADVLEKAADDIATNGLAKHALMNKQGQCCAIGAIAKALGLNVNMVGLGLENDDDYESPAIEGAARALVVSASLPTPEGGWGWGATAWDRVVSWNNARERTAEEVVEAMRLAAKDLRNEATP